MEWWEAKDLVYSNGITGIELYGHSRGTLTLRNMPYSFKQEGVHGIADNTNINFYGPAFNTSVASGLLTYVSDGKQTKVGLERHKKDIVSRDTDRRQSYCKRVFSGSSQ